MKSHRSSYPTAELSTQPCRYTITQDLLLKVVSRAVIKMENDNFPQLLPSWARISLKSSMWDNMSPATRPTLLCRVTSIRHSIPAVWLIQIKRIKKVWLFCACNTWCKWPFVSKLCVWFSPLVHCFRLFTIETPLNWYLPGASAVPTFLKIEMWQFASHKDLCTAGVSPTAIHSKAVSSYLSPNG